MDRKLSSGFFVSVGASRDRPVSLQIAGVFRMSTAEGDVTPRGRKTRALIAYLALTRGAVTPRAQVAKLLWSDRPLVQGYDGLRHCLLEARRRLRPSAGAGEVLLADRFHVGLDIASCSIDVFTPARLSELAESGSGQLLADLDRCDDSFDAWLAVERRIHHAALVADLHARLEEARLANAIAVVAKLGAALLRFAPDDPTAQRAIAGRLTA